MVVFLNGEFLPADEARISVFDRGFLYGDGLFETLPIYEGRPLLWARHIERFTQGANTLGLTLPVPANLLAVHAAELARRNQLPCAILRITLTRGVGSRGYAPGSAREPLLIMSVHPAPSLNPDQRKSWRLVTSTWRVPVNDPLTLIKSCNKLRQILARGQAEAAGADEALVLNTEGTVAEASSANVFWVDDVGVWTPPLSSGALPGVTRAVVLQLAGAAGMITGERVCRVEDLRAAQGVFLTLSSLGVVEIASLDDQLLPRSPVIEELRQAYREFTMREIAATG